MAPPVRLREYAPIDDDPDGDNSFTESHICGVALALEYCDGRGWASTRAVRCLAVDPRHPARLRAFCNVRGEERTFRFDRIISIADFRTGRILSSDEHEVLLAPYLQSAPIGQRLGDLFGLQDATVDGVRALLHLAMRDGRLSESARDIVFEYVRTEARALGLTLPWHGDVELWLDNLAPTLDTVVASVTSLLADRDKVARLLPAVMKVVRGSGTHEEEDDLRDLISEVRRHFRRKSLAWPDDLRASR